MLLANFPATHLTDFHCSQASMRGTLTACSGISAALGFFTVFLLGSMMPWRQVALVCAAVPLVVLFALCLVSDVSELRIVGHFL